MAPRRLCRRDYFAGRLRLQGGFGGERRRPPREEERGPPQLGAPGRRVGDRWGSGLRGPERRAAVPGRRLAPPLTRRQGGGEASDRCGPCGPEWGRRCREEGGTAAILQPREEVGPSGRLARRGQGGGEAPPHGSDDPREEGGSPDVVGPVARGRGGNAREEVGTAALPDAREEERHPICLDLCGPGRGGGAQGGGGASPHRPRFPGRREGNPWRNLTCRRRPRGRSR